MIAFPRIDIHALLIPYEEVLDISVGPSPGPDIKCELSCISRARDLRQSTKRELIEDQGLWLLSDSVFTNGADYNDGAFK